MEVLKKFIPTEAYDELLRVNITDVDILTRGVIHLSQVTTMSLKECEHLISEVAKVFLKTSFKSVATVPEWTRIPSSCASIDKITRGGVPVHGLTEVVGPSGVGKTQLCLQLAITVQFPVTMGGLGKGAVYICTEDIFPSKRLQQLSNAFTTRYPQHSIKYMDNIFLEHISDYEQLRRCCAIRLPRLFQQQPIGLLIVDSMAGIFRSENVNVNYATRSQQFYTIASILTRLCCDYGIAIIICNQVIGNVKTGNLEPCLGLAWSNLITCRFWISRSSGTLRTFKVIFAPDLPNSSCTFVVEESGLIGVYE